MSVIIACGQAAGLGEESKKKRYAFHKDNTAGLIVCVRVRVLEPECVSSLFKGGAIVRSGFKI